MRSVTVSMAVALLAAVAPAGVSAQSAQAVQAAHDATLKAKAITYSLRDANGTNYGTANLSIIGRTRSRIRLDFRGATTPSAVTLVRAADCRPSMNPVASSATTLSRSGPIYDTVVSVPLDALSSGQYALRMQQANAQTVCTQLR
jgi:hypothetical protein